MHMWGKSYTFAPELKSTAHEKTTLHISITDYNGMQCGYDGAVPCFLYFPLA